MYGQVDLKKSAFIGITFRHNKTIVVLNHFFCDRQAYTSAFVFGISMEAGEYIKNAVRVALLKTNPIVCDRDLVIPAFALFCSVFTGKVI
jgi:hypothetical protein